MPYLYKYRGIGTLDRDLKSLLNNQLYAPTAEKLNDPAETVLNDLSLLRVSKFLGQPIHDQLQELLAMRHNIGIYSLSKTVSDEVMWSHYGESHQGFCIEYKTERLLLEPRNQWTLFDVVYLDRPPSPDLISLITTEPEPSIVKLLAGTKSLRWHYEQEARIVTNEPGTNEYAEASVTGIYFGCRCSTSDINKIRNALSDRNIQYYRMKYREHSYDLQPENLEYDGKIDGTLNRQKAPIACGAVDYGDGAIRDKIDTAVEIVRSDPSCKQVVAAFQSTINKKQVAVVFETTVKTALFNQLPWHINISDL